MNTHHLNETGSPGTLWHPPRAARRLLLVAPPLLLAGFTVLHPQPDANPAALQDAATWFLAYHLIQLPLLGLVAVSVVLLADQLGRAAAWPTAVGTGMFLLFFGAYDTLAGVGTGLAMRSTADLPVAQRDAVFGIVEDWPGLEPAVLWLSLAGTGGWVLAVGYLALAVRGAGASRAQWIPLATAALFLMAGHPAPFGTIAFGSLGIAALVHERHASRPPVAQDGAVAVAGRSE